MRKKLLRTVVAIVGAAALVFGSQTAASAADHGSTSTHQVVQQNTAAGFCRAEAVLLSDGYAYAIFWNWQVGWDCTMWIERTANGGATWWTISAPETKRDLPGDDLDLIKTELHPDGSGYLVRSCFHLNFSGAAKHCTYGV